MIITLNRDEKRALISTIIFHALLILLFIFSGLKYLEPPPPEEGILINFGTTDEGSGDVQAQSNSEVVEEISMEQVSEKAVTSKAAEKVITQNTEEAPKVTSDKNESKQKEEVIPEEPKPSKELSSAMSKWKNKSDSKSTSDGNTGNKGDQGDPSGSLESGSYIGGAGGSGYKFDLNGRKMISRPVIKDVSQVEGKVVVDIVVDKNGNVVRATPGVRGSTTTSEVLYRAAKDAALSTKFNSSHDAAEQQKGQIVFTFLLKG